MTPELEKILDACVADVDWFIKIFEERAGADDEGRFEKPLERFQLLRARLELLRNTTTIALLKSSAKGGGAELALSFADEVKGLKGDATRAAEGVERVDESLRQVSGQLADMQKYLSSSSLEEIFRALIRAAGGSPPRVSASKAVTAKADAGKAPTIEKPKQPPKAAANGKAATEPAKALGSKSPTDFFVNRYHVDLNTLSVKFERVQCQDYEDALGGIARAFKVLEKRPVTDAYDPGALLIMNLGLLSGSDFMTGLRTYFHGYSPLKVGGDGKPGSMWTAGSGKFGTKLRFLDIEEVFFTGRCEKPMMLRLAPAGEEGEILPEGRKEGDGFGVVPGFHFVEAADLVGKLSNDKIQLLRERYGKNAHFAVIGPAGENYQNVRYAAIALSTVNQLRSGDNKPRFCGRGGFGGVLGSKNLIAFVADGPDRLAERPRPSAKLKEINGEVARGKGSARFRDKRKANGGGGTWANYESLNPLHAMPEMNFIPTGTEVSFKLHRPAVEEEGQFVVKDEACFRCGIACHKNVYDAVEKNGKLKPGKFRAKLDFEPLNLLASNIGIFDMDQACELVELVDLYCMDSISIGVSLSYVMEYNKRNPDKPIVGGLSYGDYKGAHQAVVDIGTGKLPLVGQGSKRMSEELGAPEFAMHCKGIEFPAYLPQTNPGYPWALAGGHMSMRTYLLLLYDRDVSLEYWVDAITNRGPNIMRDDIIGVCKFSALSDDKMCEAIAELTDLKIDPETLRGIVQRTYLRGYKMEKAQGFTKDDYVMPKVAHDHFPQIELPYFNTPEFFKTLQGEVLQTFDKMLDSAGL